MKSFSKPYNTFKIFLYEQGIVLVFLLSIALTGMSIGKNLSVEEAHVPNTSSGNPAEMYCTEIMGYNYYVKTAPDGGQSGICVLPNNQECNQWDFYAGTCGAEYSYCVQQGYDLETKTTGRDPFASKHSVCVDKENGYEELASQLSSLANLVEASQINQTIEIPETTIYSLEENSDTLSAQNFPATWDWRNHDGQNWMTPAKNQYYPQYCGACWAFASVGAAEAHHNIISESPNLNLNLSEQELVSCSEAGNCTSGRFDLALTYIRDNGIVDESCMPYTGTNSSCTKCSNWQTRLTSIDAYHIIYVTSQSLIKEKLIKYGPVVVNMGTVGVGQYFDSNGIFRCADDTTVA